MEYVYAEAVSAGRVWVEARRDPTDDAPNRGILIDRLPDTLMTQAAADAVIGALIERRRRRYEGVVPLLTGTARSDTPTTLNYAADRTSFRALPGENVLWQGRPLASTPIGRRWLKRGCATLAWLVPPAAVLVRCALDRPATRAAEAVWTWPLIVAVLWGGLWCYVVFIKRPQAWLRLRRTRYVLTDWSTVHRIEGGGLAESSFFYDGGTSFSVTADPTGVGDLCVDLVPVFEQIADVQAIHDQVITIWEDRLKHQNMWAVT